MTDSTRVLILGLCTLGWLLLLAYVVVSQLLWKWRNEKSPRG